MKNKKLNELMKNKKLVDVDDFLVLLESEGIIEDGGGLYDFESNCNNIEHIVDYVDDEFEYYEYCKNNDYDWEKVVTIETFNINEYKVYLVEGNIDCVIDAKITLDLDTAIDYMQSFKGYNIIGEEVEALEKKHNVSIEVNTKKRSYNVIFKNCLIAWNLENLSNIENILSDFNDFVSYIEDIAFYKIVGTEYFNGNVNLLLESTNTHFNDLSIPRNIGNIDNGVNVLLLKYFDDIKSMKCTIFDDMPF